LDYLTAYIATALQYMEVVAGGKGKPERADRRTQGSIPGTQRFASEGYSARDRPLSSPAGNYYPDRRQAMWQIITIEADLRRSLEIKSRARQEHPLSEF
jgi:hypothetical protein